MSENRNSSSTPHNMQIKHIYRGLSISAIAKILQNKIHFCSNEALFEFEAQQLKGFIKKG